MRCGAPPQPAVVWNWRGDSAGWARRADGQDSGPGIAPGAHPRLTERFIQVDRSRSRETGGTGLGLAIVKHVPQRHGAELRIESQPGQGSSFAMVLPSSRIRRLNSDVVPGGFAL